MNTYTYQLKHVERYDFLATKLTYSKIHISHLSRISKLTKATWLLLEYFIDILNAISTQYYEAAGPAIQGDIQNETLCPKATISQIRPMAQL